MGLTKVLCVVRGPCEVGRRSEELPDRYVYIKLFEYDVWFVQKLISIAD